MAKNNLMDMMGMLGQFKDIQERMQETQQDLAAQKFEGCAGENMVKVVVTGKQDCVEVEISPEMMKEENRRDQKGAES